MRYQDTRTHTVYKGHQSSSLGWEGRGGGVTNGDRNGWKRMERNSAVSLPQTLSGGPRFTDSAAELAHPVQPSPQSQKGRIECMSRHSPARYPLVVSVSRKSYSNSIRFYKIRPARCPSPEFLSCQPPASFSNWPSASGPVHQPLCLAGRPCGLPVTVPPPFSGLT